MTVNLNTLSASILIGWLRSLLTGNQDDIDGFVMIMQMSGTDQQTSLKNYLTARVTNNSSQASSLNSINNTNQAAITSDTSTCNALITTLNS